MSKNLISILVFVLILLGTTGLTAYLVDLPKFYSLNQNVRSGTGKVISKERANHMSIGFQYQVDDQVFSSIGNAGDIGRTFDSVEVGDSLPISYDTSNPQSAVIGQPQKYLFSAIRGMVFVFLGLCISLFWYLIKGR